MGSVIDVLTDPQLEALPADPRERGDYLSDRINPPVKPR